MIIAVGSDHAGYIMKSDVVSWLQTMGYQVLDMGCTNDRDSVDYPLFAEKVAKAVISGDAVYGVLVCGTGIGMSITANKIPGIRAALCGETFSAHASRAHNDANILVLGARVIGSGLAREILEAFLSADFEGGRHQNRINLIKMLEND
ncbi:MAG: ribose 5-phosphate isomerase B [Methylocystaceae bacterium]